MASVTISKETEDNNVEFDSGQQYLGPLFLVTMLFFMWGFITCMNDILIPHLQQVFTLQNWQAMLIQTAFFGAYFFISLGYYLISITKGDPIGRIGYKNGIILGLVISAVGCLFFYPAASLVSFGFFLFALFVLASGITILQIAANPYVTILGKPSGASSRLNMTQAFNSLGTTIAPLIGGYLIFGAIGDVDISADSVKMPYVALALTLLLIALIFKLFKLPEIGSQGVIISDSGALKHRHLMLGIGAIFAYVGGEVTVGSNLINFARLPEIAGLDEAEASHYLALFWGGAMVGRFFGAVALADFKHNLNRFLIIGAITAISYVTIYYVYGGEMALYALAFIGLNIVVIIIGQFIPNRTLWLFGITGIGLLVIGLLTSGQLALWSIVALGLFNSIMFPTIFSLAIKGLGKYTAQASSLLVMAIVGGAIVPLLQGLLADISGSVQLSFLVPLACYLYIVFYGMKGYRVEEG
ncbi:sugar MFS transporter [Echinicola vietnamensis]|uniref:Fucose permease n=1 Tax=Echinicola vietnamensis (strain DSM 17526 / LMG 23754 / KMM 6221) TaxID=926556 RepID=L0G1P2_ECHVK|nr:sugar MFS transporter [Echinicola vietnamensis]AGA80119.1 fucose permease [Echinicola vietnamensis DSM 17526]